MSVNEILKTVEFVVDRNGKPKAAMVDIEIWETFVTWLEGREDTEIVQTRMAGWRDKKGWRRWDEFDAELEANVLPAVA